MEIKEELEIETQLETEKCMFKQFGGKKISHEQNKIH